MFIIMPPMTRHQRFSPVLPTSIESALFAIVVLISSLPFDGAKKHSTPRSRRQPEMYDCLTTLDEGYC